MIKPANNSDSELLEENEVSSLITQEKGDKEDELIKEMLNSKDKIDQLLEKECLEQDKKI
jgi:hypothetical protein